MAHSAIIGLPMAKSIAIPAANPDTDSSFQLQLMKRFTRASEIHLPVNQKNY
jgi:hypothetical protein